METQVQRWSAKRKVELLLSLVKGERKLVDVCCEHDLKQSGVEGWVETFLKSGERGLKANAEDEVAVREHEIKELRAKIGELVLELDATVDRREAPASESTKPRGFHGGPSHVLG